MPTISIAELKKRYKLGERNFAKIDLQGSNLQGIELEKINFNKANLRGANLTDCNLRGACLDEADFSEANLLEADLDEASAIQANFDRANLTSASLNETQLIRALLNNGVNLKGAYLIGAFLNGAQLMGANLNKANLMGAHLDGAYLKEALLKGALLTGAYYNSHTQFDINFNPAQAGMFKISDEVEKGETSISELLALFNSICKFSCKYLGNTLTAQYLEATKPKLEWLQKFQFERTGKLIFSGSITEVASQEQLKSLKNWLDSFMARCSLILPGFKTLI